MPFKSEAQRRYLWANEPEIARDWTDTYGSKIHAANGGIMRLGFANGLTADPFYQDGEFQTFPQPQHFNLNDYPYRGPVQSGYTNTGKILGYPGEAGYDDNLYFEKDFRGNKLSDTGVQMRYKTPRTIQDQLMAAYNYDNEGDEIEEIEGIGGIGGIEGIKEFATNVKDKFTGGVDYVKDKIAGGGEFIKTLPATIMGNLADMSGVGLLMHGLQGLGGPQLTQAQKDMNEQFFQCRNRYTTKSISNDKWTFPRNECTRNVCIWFSYFTSNGTEVVR